MVGSRPVTVAYAGLGTPTAPGSGGFEGCEAIDSDVVVKFAQVVAGREQQPFTLGPVQTLQE